MEDPGTVYLIHFERPHHHARHYVGWTTDVQRRFDEHLNGQSRTGLMKAVYDARIPIRLVRTWVGDKNFERSLKKRKNSAALCPVCSGKENECKS